MRALPWSIALGLLAGLPGAAAAQHSLAALAPQGCRASGLWVLERHPAQTVSTHWVTIAMAPWDSWTTGFVLADGAGGALILRVSDARGDLISLTATQGGRDGEPTLFVRRTDTGCEFATTGEPDLYRFRRER